MGMTYTIALPIADRRAARDFYTAALGLEPFGPPGGDGIPEPLQFALAGGVSLMLIPTGGFGWVVGEGRPAEPGRSECLLSIVTADVDAAVERAHAAGALIVAEPAQQSWGYAATFEDPDRHLWMILRPDEPRF
ncbi:hypothetical protein GCM10022255_022430 [Dactylosporangium darangshiense]|uniref:VOC domain-containing protein n=2 Tax=Dactylosporangium darangshiense TaxID=579108 RepID=A0ABP8D4I0_9ACTN